MNRIKKNNKTHTLGSFPRTAIRNLGLLSVLALGIGCSSNPSPPGNRQRTDFAVSPSSVTREQAKAFVAKNYSEIFDGLYLDSPSERKKLKLPEMKAEEFQVVKQDPVYWYVSYEPEAGLWLEARVEKTHGTVEWITVAFAPE